MSETMAPAAELREAADLMRERAKRALPWWGGSGNTLATLRSGDPQQSGRERLLEYQLTMHPAVALAVADWLEAEAFLAGDAPDGRTFYPLRLARAYLELRER